MRRLVILRPEPGASATLARAADWGLDAMKMPLFRIEPVAWAPPNPGSFDGLLVTSAAGVREAGPRLGELKALPVHAVGEATAEACRAAGLSVATTGARGVEALLATVDPSARLLHLCGEDRHGEVDRPSITPLVVYKAAPLAEPARLDRLADAVVMIHSPRAGRRLAELAADRTGTRIAAISAAAASACGSGWAEVAVAESPRDDALLSLAARLCKGPDPE